jgi:hypothetical protein
MHIMIQYVSGTSTYGKLTISNWFIQTKNIQSLEANSNYLHLGNNSAHNTATCITKLYSHNNQE